MKSVYVFFAEGFEEIEGLTVVDVLRRAQIEVKMVSVTGKMEVTGSHGISVRMDQLIDEVKEEEADMLVLPGGMPGTKNLEQCDRLIEMLRTFHQKQKWIAAICAAPMILGHLQILKGKKACCYPGNEGHLDGAEVLMVPSVIDGNVITGRGMGVANDFSLNLVKVLEGEETAERIGKSILFIPGK